MSIANLLVPNNLTIYADNAILPSGTIPSYNRSTGTMPTYFGTSLAGSVATGVLANVVFNRVTNATQPGIVILTISLQANIVTSTAGYIFLKLSDYSEYLNYLIDAETISNTTLLFPILDGGLPKIGTAQMNYSTQSIQISELLTDTTHGYLNSSATSNDTINLGGNASSSGFTASSITIIYQQAFA